jgi:hypothetical protein
VQIVALFKTVEDDLIQTDLFLFLFICLKLGIRVAHCASGTGDSFR